MYMQNIEMTPSWSIENYADQVSPETLGIISFSLEVVVLARCQPRYLCILSASSIHSFIVLRSIGANFSTSNYS